MSYRVETGAGWELRLGRWQDVLADVERCDAVICDPPYSERTHAGHGAGASLPNRGTWERSDGGVDLCRPRSEIAYSHLTPEDVRSFVGAWAPRCAGWMAAFSDSDLFGAWRAAMESSGRTGFQPLPCVVRGMSVRLAGDGPSSWATYLNVSRPKALFRWGTLPGAYTGSQGDRLIVGSKPLDMMRAIIRDYTHPGDLVVDPCAGSGTTLLAAVTEGRRAIGAEMDPATFELAVARLRKGHTPDMFAPRETPAPVLPGELFGPEEER